MKHEDEWTLEDHARAWWKDQGLTMPDGDTDEGERMYQAWIDYAFEAMEDTPNGTRH